jgi:hypothetical protein
MKKSPEIQTHPKKSKRKTQKKFIPLQLPIDHLKLKKKHFEKSLSFVKQNRLELNKFTVSELKVSIQNVRSCYGYEKHLNTIKLLEQSHVADSDICILTETRTPRDFRLLDKTVIQTKKVKAGGVIQFSNNSLHQQNIKFIQ